jgi:hypothetical protein
MATSVPALGGSPLTFVDPQTGKQYQIPLSLLSYPAGGGPIVFTPQPGSALLAPTLNAQVTDFVRSLATQGLLTPGIPLPTSAGFEIVAAQPGPSGNFTSVTFARPTPGPTGPTDLASTVDVTVTAQQVFPNLTTSLASVSGLVTASPTTIAFGGASIPSPGFVPPVPPTGAATAVTWKVFPKGTSIANPGSTPPLFTLTAASGSPSDMALTQVQIQNNATNGAVTSFTLLVSWTKTARAVPLSTFAATNPSPNPFGYLVTFSQPSGGPALTLPRAGTVNLSGGTTGTAATAMPLTA